LGRIFIQYLTISARDDEKYVGKIAASALLILTIRRGDELKVF
jgi:hypothetical protein